MKQLHSEMPDAMEIPQEMLDLYLAMRRERKLPLAWKPVAQSLPGWYRHGFGLAVIETINRERDGKIWHHVSASRASRVPDWTDMLVIRLDFIGPDRESYIVLPPESRYVNTCPYALHLWCCLDQPDGVLPDFRHAGQI